MATKVLAQLRVVFPAPVAFLRGLRFGATLPPQLVDTFTRRLPSNCVSLAMVLKNNPALNGRDPLRGHWRAIVLRFSDSITQCGCPHQNGSFSLLLFPLHVFTSVISMSIQD